MKCRRKYININYEYEKFYGKIIPSILKTYSNEELYNVINDSMGSILTLLHLIKYSLTFFEGDDHKIEGHLCYCYQQETLKIATKLLNGVRNDKCAVSARDYRIICNLFENMIKILEEIYIGDSKTVMVMIRPESYGHVMTIPEDIPEIKFMSPASFDVVYQRQRTSSMLGFITQIFITATNILKEKVTNGTIDMSEINTFNTSLINRYIVLGGVYETEVGESPVAFINKNVRSMDKEYLYDVFKINRMHERELQLNNIGMEVIGSYCFA